MATSEPRIRCDSVSKSFGDNEVVKGLDLQIENGEFVSLLGPSGSGKTTLLMMLAGFEIPSQGGIYIDGKRIDHLPPYRRNMGVVFQNYALFPHMTIAENIAFPLEMRGVGRSDVQSRVKRSLELVQLYEIRERYPSQLSGGQQQRIALARALVFEPAVILMDEPLSALDKHLREQMQLDIRALHQRLGLTVVFVTHDQSEALTMSDRIAVFNQGVIEQIGSARDIYDRPQTRFVAEFIGETNLFEGDVVSCDAQEAAVQLKDCDIQWRVNASKGLAVGDKVVVSVRPERIRLSQAPDGHNGVHGHVLDSVYQGDHLRIQLDTSAAKLIVRADRSGPEWQKNSGVYASFNKNDCWVMVS